MSQSPVTKPAKPLSREPLSRLYKQISQTERRSGKNSERVGKVSHEDLDGAIIRSLDDGAFRNEVDRHMSTWSVTPPPHVLGQTELLIRAGDRATLRRAGIDPDHLGAWITGKAASLGITVDAPQPANDGPALG